MNKIEIWFIIQDNNYLHLDTVYLFYIHLYTCFFLFEII